MAEGEEVIPAEICATLAARQISQEDAQPHLHEDLTGYQSGALREYSEVKYRCLNDAPRLSHFSQFPKGEHAMDLRPDVKPKPASHAHGHGEKQVSLISALVSSVINFLLMFGLCCAYGMILFGDPWNQKHQGLGVKMCLGTALISGLGIAAFSKVPVAIGGPDLNPVVMLGTIAGIISEEVAKENGLTVPSGDRRLFSAIWGTSESWRRLGGGGGGCGTSSEEFCTGQHYLDHLEACELYHEEMRATTIFAVAFTSFALMLIFFLLGRFRLSKYVSYIPSAIMEAFLSCIGYKVFKYGLKFCLNEPRQFIPAALVGVPLYFMKAYHVGNPAIVIPAMLLIPLGIFYVVMIVAYGTDHVIDKARADCYFFPSMEDVDFWRIWTDGLFNVERISIKAWSKAAVDVVIMVIVVLLDCLLKLAGTDAKLPLQCHKDYELQVYGTLNLLNAACGSTVGYMQLKFNVINFGIIGNVKDRRAGLFYALWCGICFFTTIKLINYMPRFFLGVLLFFAGAGFVCENLWGSRKYLSLLEWGQILFIIIVFVLTDKLLYAVIAGFLVAGFDFIRRYAKVPIVRGPALSGGALVSLERYDPILRRIIGHMAESWALAVQLKGYLFFASVQALTRSLEQRIAEQTREDLPEHVRLRFFIFDCKLLDGIDASAAKNLQNFVRGARKRGVRVLWACAAKELVDSLITHGTLEDERDSFTELVDAVGLVEKAILQRINYVQERWCTVHPFFCHLHRQMCMKVECEPFHNFLDLDAARFGCPWQYCSRVRIQRFRTVLFARGEVDGDLFLIHSGAVGLFEHPPALGEEWGTPMMVLRHGMLLNMEMLTGAASKAWAVALEDGEVLFWNTGHWWRMTTERPFMTAALSKGIVAQYDGEERILQHNLLAKKQKDHEDMPAEEHGSLLAPKYFDALGFYSAVGPHMERIRPQLPNVVKRDLEIAFATFCQVDASGGMDAKELLHPEHVVQALLYAGIAGTLFTQVLQQPVRLVEFLELGHEAFMMPLSVATVEDIHKIFDTFDLEKNGNIEAPAVASIMHSLFKLSRHVTANTVSLFLTDGSVSRENFVGFISRILRRCEPQWHMLQVLPSLVSSEHLAASPAMSEQVPSTKGLLASRVQEVLATQGMARENKQDGAQFHGAGEMLEKKVQCDYRLKVSTLTDMGYGSDEEIMEMFWVANGYDTDITSNSEEIDFRLVLELLSTAYSEPKPLPPPPRMPKHGPREQLHPSSGQELRRLVADLRGYAGERRSELAQLDLHTDLVDTTADETHSMAAAKKNGLFRLMSEHPVAARRRMQKPKQPEPKRRVADGTAGAKPAVKVEDPDDTEEEDDYVQWQITKKKVLTTTTWRAKIHLLFEHPESSRAAKLLSMSMAVLIICSVMTLVAEPLISSTEEDDRSAAEKAVWLGFEIFFTTIFTLELLVRLVVADATGAKTTCDFIKEPMNICDVLAVVPFYVELALDLDSGAFRLLRVVRLTRLARMARLGRLSRFSQIFPPIAMCLTVIWGIYLKTIFSDDH